MENLSAKITQLKNEKNAIILAHYYQSEEIQSIADFIGDSLELSKKAAETTADIVLFAGVHFMAETAKILNPSKKVIIPDIDASCSLAESCKPEDFKSFIEQHPNHTVISYINCSAEIKALSDVVCTSSNAEKIIESFAVDTPIIFAPDKNLGHYLRQKTGRKLVLWDGSCVVHEAFSLYKLIALHKQHPDAKIIAHPESEANILATASYIGSTSGMIEYVKNDPSCTKYIIATEVGILHKMRQEVPYKTFIPVPTQTENNCHCSECGYMKMNTLKKVYNCLLEEKPEIQITETIREKAQLPIDRMLELS